MNLIRKIINAFILMYIKSPLYTIVLKFKNYLLSDEARRAQLLSWLQATLPARMVPKNFNVDWRDGIKLFTLCEMIIPGTCPKYDLLIPINYSDNLTCALCLIKIHLGIKSDITVEEIYECKNESKLIQLLLLIKNACHTLSLNKNRKKRKKRLYETPEWQYLESFQMLFRNCHITGMGTTLGTLRRKTKFSIVFQDYYPVDLTLIVQIHGPNQSFCSEIIHFNDKFETNFTEIDETTQYLVIRASLKIKDDESKLIIPLFYESFSDCIKFTYIPLFVGKHKISIIWQGRHVLSSPYFVTIQDADYLKQNVNDIGVKFNPGVQYPLSLLKTQKFGFQTLGTVVRKKILKKSIIVEDKEFDYDSYLQDLQKTYENEIDEISSRTISKNLLKNDNKPNVEINIQPPIRKRHQKHQLNEKPIGINKQTSIVSDSSSVLSDESDIYLDTLISNNNPKNYHHEKYPKIDIQKEIAMIKIMNENKNPLTILSNKTKNLDTSGESDLDEDKNEIGSMKTNGQKIQSKKLSLKNMLIGKSMSNNNGKYLENERQSIDKLKNIKSYLKRSKK